MPKLRFEATGILTPHPMLERVGTMLSLSNQFAKRAKKAGKNREEHKERHQELEGDWLALVESVRERGVIEPVKVCRIPADQLSEADRTHGKIWWIVDGRNRYAAASITGRKRIPVIRVAPQEAAGIIAATVAGRRHYSKSATAYLAVLLNPGFAMEGRERQKQGVKLEPSAQNAEGLAGRFSVSVRLLDQAAELYRLLETDGKKFRADAEANVWAGDGLGAILAGVKSLIATGKLGDAHQSDAHKRAVAAWGFTNKACGQLSSAWERWSDLAEEQRALATDRLRETLLAAPEDIKSLLKDLV